MKPAGLAVALAVVVLVACVSVSSGFNMRQLVQTMQVAQEEVVAEGRDAFNWADHALFKYVEKLPTNIGNEVSFYGLTVFIEFCFCFPGLLALFCQFWP